MAKNQKQTTEASQEQVQAPEAKVDPRTVKLGHQVTVTIEKTNKDGEITSSEEHTYPSKSMAIVSLHRDHNVSRGDIARYLEIRYQFVYNVLKRRGMID